jgi:hypothetical protein
MVQGRLALFKVALGLLSIDQSTFSNSSCGISDLSLLAQILSLSAFDEVLRVVKQRGRNSGLPPPAEFLRLVDSQPLTPEHLRAMEQLYVATRRNLST